MTTTINASTTLGLQHSADTSGILQLQTAGTAALTINSSQNVGIGTSSPALKLHVVGDNVSARGQLSLQTSSASNFAQMTFYNQTTLGASIYQSYADNSWNFSNSQNAPITFSTNSSERARITSSGGLWVGTSTRQSTSNHTFVATSEGDWIFNSQANTTTSASAIGNLIRYNAVSPNGTGNVFLRCEDSTTNRFDVRSNGGVANYSANNANLSDERTKTDIQDAGGYLAKICAIPVRTFKYKDQTDDELNLGVIAQEVESVAPELVDVSGFGETPEDGVPLKAIYQTDLQYALMKCIQEQQALITTLTERITALENK